MFSRFEVESGKVAMDVRLRQCRLLHVMLSLLGVQGLVHSCSTALSHALTSPSRPLSFLAAPILAPYQPKTDSLLKSLRSRALVARSQRNLRIKPFLRTEMAESFPEKCSGIFIFADPGAASAEARATELAGQLMERERRWRSQGCSEMETNPVASADNAGGGSESVASYVSLTIPSECPGPSIFFGERGLVELLKAGEAVGQGLRSELPDVLASQCRQADLQRDPLLKAVGKQKKGLTVTDATAGFAHDSLRMAAAGLRVTALERDPVLHAFVSGGLSALQEHDDTRQLFHQRIADAGGSLELRLTDAVDYFQASAQQGHHSDIVYLDPMFPSAKRKSALPKRRMQWLRGYLEGVDDGEEGGAKGGIEELVSAARQASPKVVLKRADDGPKIGKPSGSIASSKIVRYDIYVGAVAVSTPKAPSSPKPQPQA